MEDPLDALLEQRPSNAPSLKASSLPTLQRELPRRQRKLTGIAPVFDRPQSYSDFHIINASRTGQLAPPQIIVPKRKSFWHTLKGARLIDRLVHNWIIEEIWLVMNKLTLFGLVMGLMFLGIIFFLVGFMTAYKTFPSPEAAPKDTTHPWVQAHQGPGAPAGAAPGASPAPSAVSGTVSAGMEGLESRFESRLVGKVAKAASISPAIQKAIPAPLQPFAHHATNQVMIRATGGSLHATHQAEKKIRETLGLSAPRPSTEYGALPAGYGASGKYAHPAQGVAQPAAPVPQTQMPSQVQMQPQAYPAQGQAYTAQATYVPPQQLPPAYAAQAKPAQMPAAYVGGYIVGGPQAYAPQAMVAPLPPATAYVPTPQAQAYPGQAYPPQAYAAQQAVVMPATQAQMYPQAATPQGYTGQVAPQVIYTPQAYAPAPRAQVPYQMVR